MNGIPSHFGLLKQALTETTLRHRVVGNNIANVNTPEYKAQDVLSFSHAMDEAGGGQGQPAIGDKDGLRARKDGNNVDIDVEMGGLKQNAMKHNLYTQILVSKVRQMRMAISGR